MASPFNLCLMDVIRLKFSICRSSTVVIPEIFCHYGVEGEFSSMFITFTIKLIKDFKLVYNNTTIFKKMLKKRLESDSFIKNIKFC